VPNVLTFAYDPPPRPGRGRAARGPVRADVVVCLARAAREAREQGKPLRDHLAHLVVHGVLHAHGMDHLEPSDAARMQSRESAVLARFGIPDPWR
jgi:probable rRNA maturation factor